MPKDIHEHFYKSIGHFREYVSQNIDYAKKHKRRSVALLVASVLLGSQIGGVIRYQSNMLEAMSYIKMHAKQPEVQQRWIDYALKEAELADSIKGLIPFYKAIWKNEKPDERKAQTVKLEAIVQQ